MSDARAIIAEAIDAPWTDVPARTRHKIADRIIAALAKAGLEIRPAHQLADLAARQEPLGAEFDAALLENVEELYEP